MINQALVDYIKSVKSQGYEAEAVFEALKGSGWKEEDINEAFDFITKTSHLPVGSTPSLKTYHYVSEEISKDLNKKNPATLPPLSPPIPPITDPLLQPFQASPILSNTPKQKHRPIYLQRPIYFIYSNLKKSRTSKIIAIIILILILYLGINGFWGGAFTLTRLAIIVLLVVGLIAWSHRLKNK